MALVYLDRAMELSRTEGSGAYDLDGAVIGYQAFTDVGDGNTCYYAATDGRSWEVGLGTYVLASSRLIRTTILDGSNGTSPVNWLAGSKNVWIDYPANAIAAAGIVTTVSVATANGFAGSSSGGATPQLTLSTTVNAPALAGDGTAIGAATTTGSGSTVVLADSPALISPDLGTPTALALTNATGTPASIGLANGTGLPLATGVTGILPTANGGEANVATRTALSNVDTTKNTVSYLYEAGRQGWFQWDSSNLSTYVTGDARQGVYVAPASAPTGASGAWVRVGAQVLNVMWFGATGDGVTDDAAAIQGAINLAYTYSAGHNVYLPAGNYLFGTQISIPKTAGKSCRFFGDGTNATLLTIAAALDTTGGAIAIGSASSAGGCDIIIENLSVTGANTKKAFYLTNANICHFHHVECRSVAIGVQLETSYFVQVYECEFDSCATYGIVTVTTAHGLRVENSGFYAITGQGIYLAGASQSDNIIITGNDFETTTTPIQFDPGVNSLIFTGNYVEYATGALWVFGAASYGVQIDNNWLAFSTSTALNNLSGGSFSHNDLYDQAVTVGTISNFTGYDNRLRGTATLGNVPNLISPMVLNTGPVTKTADFTVAATETYLINNKSGSTCTVTLPAASSWTGRIIRIKTIQAQTTVSASSNVVPLGTAVAGTAILSANAGRWAELVSDGTNWVIMSGVV